MHYNKISKVTLFFAQVNAVKGIVDEDLGFVESAATVKSNTKVNP